MDTMTAIEWVGNNQDSIRRKIETYRIYSPYEDMDYLQEAYLSALVAVHRSAAKGILFEAAFWTIFKERLGKMTPHPESSSGSNSIPSHLCDTEIETIDIARDEQRHEPDIEAIYCKLNRYLTCREQRVLCLALGITHVGRLSNYEIASHLGCRESNIRDALNKAMERIRDLVRSGRIVPEELVSRDIGGRE
jgi:DNA-binding NarL/FixJ family response regulator